MASVRDWQLHGVELKVELSTAGSLVAGSNQWTYDLQPGGSGGVPLGWNQWYSHPQQAVVAHYNWTTSAGITSSSYKQSPNYYDMFVGASSPEFQLRQGYRYQIQAEARQMAGKAATRKQIALQVQYGTWSNETYANNISVALADWEPVTLPLSSHVLYTKGRIVVGGGSPQGQITDWGAQFQKIIVSEIPYSQTAALEWVDITCDVRNLNIRYGREKFTERYDIGSLQVELANDEGIYSYHMPHPLNLQPGRQVRITATKDGKSYPMAFHIIDSIRDGYTLDGHVISVLECVDPASVLSNQTVRATQIPVIFGMYPRSHTRVQTLIEQVGYLNYRLLAASNMNAAWEYNPVINASGRTVRDEIGVTGDSEGGAFYAERDGALVYIPREHAVLDPDPNTVTANMIASADMPDVPLVDEVPTYPDAPTICVNQLNNDWSMARVVNLVSLANAGGTAQTFKDEESLKAHGPRTYERMDYVLLNDTHLPERANDFLDGFAEPVLRVNTIGYAPGIGGDWDFALSVFLNWLVRVWYRNEENRWGYAVCLHVQSVEHRITPTDWSIAMSVDQPISFVELEDSEYGWDMGLWDEALWDQYAPAGALWSDPESTWSTAGDNWGE